MDVGERERRWNAHGDHLDRLLLNGEGGSGAYRPQRFELYHGADDDRVVHLHEAHHAALNDSTSWGTLLHLLARLPPPFGDAFGSMLDACRRTHETFATFASISLLISRGESTSELIAPYPDYGPLFEDLADATQLVEGPNRRYLLATTAARVAMQSPVLSQFTVEGLRDIRPASLRRIDIPDGRWEWMLRRPAAWWARAASEADAIARDRHGDVALRLDTAENDPLAAVALRHDAAWAEWERAAYAVFANELSGQSATVLAFNGHQDLTDAAIAVAKKFNPGLGLAAASRLNPARDDRTLASAVVEQARHVFGRALRWPARLDHPSVTSLVSTVQATSVIAGRPALVVSVRLPRRLAALFTWSTAGDAMLEELPHPVVAVRTIEEGDPDDVIVHHLIDSPTELRRLREAWPAAGTFNCCVAASCLIDLTWQKQWLGVMREAGPISILIDVELDRFVNSWVRTGTVVKASVIEIEDTAGPRRALAVSPGDDVIWIAIGDRLGTDLLLRQLLDTTDLRVESSALPLEARGDSLAALITHLLATEPFFDLSGLDGSL